MLIGGIPQSRRLSGLWWAPNEKNPHLLQHVDEVLEYCDVRSAVDCAPHIPDGSIAGSLPSFNRRAYGWIATVSMFNEKLQVALLFLSDILALHVMDVFPENSILTPARSTNPHEV